MVQYLDVIKILFNEVPLALQFLANDLVYDQVQRFPVEFAPYNFLNYYYSYSCY